MENQRLENCNCPLCGNERKRVVFSDFAPFSVVRCQTCGFHYLSPRLDENSMLAHYRSSNYFEGEGGGYDSYESQEPALRATFRRLAAAMDKRGLTGGRLFEIGCGYGYLLDEARSYFSESIGSDFSDTALQSAQRFATRVVKGGVDDVAATEQFDVIVATHVIEHVYRPHDFMRSIKARLRPGGKALVAAPDMGSFWRKVMGSKWPSFKLPEHILFFDKHSLARLLSETGFHDIHEIPYPHAFPLPLVAKKLGFELPMSLHKKNIWIPKTTVALYGTRLD
jgi:2-polyprenyl-3-methyl-5-hydroxy-6-metoxy-1,4-benzoquinol methylase